MLTKNQVQAKLETWLSRFKYSGKTKYKIDHLPPKKMGLMSIASCGRGEDRFLVQIWTASYKYSIIAGVPTKERPAGYLGCTMSTRAPSPGESWTTGNDLADGSFRYKTWVSILEDIVGCESKEVKPVRKRRHLLFGSLIAKADPMTANLMRGVLIQVMGKLRNAEYVFDADPLPRKAVQFRTRLGALGELFKVCIWPKAATIQVIGGDEVRYDVSLADPNCIEKAYSYIVSGGHGRFK